MGLCQTSPFASVCRWWSDTNHVKIVRLHDLYYVKNTFAREPCLPQMKGLECRTQPGSRPRRLLYAVNFLFLWRWWHALWRIQMMISLFGHLGLKKRTTLQMFGNGIVCVLQEQQISFILLLCFYKEMTIITNQLSWADNGYPLHNEVGCLLQELAWLRPKPEVTSHVPCHPYLAPTNHHSPAPESFCTPAIAFLAKHGLWNGGAWSSVFRCASVSIKDSLLSTPVIPSFCHIFGFPFCQRLWALTKHRDDSMVGDMVDDMVGDKEVHMVADMEVDKVDHMEADKKREDKKWPTWK